VADEGDEGDEGDDKGGVASTVDAMAFSDSKQP